MKYIIIAGIGIIVIFLISLSFIPLGIEPLTEMYFENHTNLPVSIILNEDYNFSFSVHNLEYQNMSYFYNITSEYNNKTMSINSGNFKLENNETITIFQNFSINEHFGRAKVDVMIIKNSTEKPEFMKRLWWPNPDYANEIDIHFWVDEIVK